MDITKHFATNEKAELEGVWVPLMEGARLLVAREGNPRYKEAMAKRSAPFKTLMRSGQMTEEMAAKILIEVIAETVLLGWEGIEENGQQISYSRENALQLLTKYREFRDFVVKAAQDVEVFKSQEEAEEAKN